MNLFYLAASKRYHDYDNISLICNKGGIILIDVVLSTTEQKEWFQYNTTTESQNANSQCSGNTQKCVELSD